LVRGFLFFGF